jgi:hypothetical protein
MGRVSSFNEPPKNKRNLNYRFSFYKRATRDAG